jgi:hypothetical protein
MAKAARESNRTRISQTGILKILTNIKNSDQTAKFISQQTDSITKFRR